MKLLFAHDHRFLRGCGDEIYTQGSFPAEIWDRYLRHFDTVSVVARDEGRRAGERLARSDRPRVHFELVRPPSFAERLGIVRGEASRALREAASEADAVVARFPSDIGLLAAGAAHDLGKPLLLEIVGCALDGYGNQGSLLARLYAPLAMRRMRRAVARASFVLYVTDRWLQARYPHHRSAAVTSASNVSISAAAQPVTARRERRLAALARGEPPVLGTVASLRTASKGIQTMLAAFGQLRRTHGAKAQYRILGPGDPAQWKALADSHGVADLVRFDGSLPAGEPVLEWLDGIDIHCQPSFQEGLPRATIEAMSRGCACIGSTAGGIPELLAADRLHSPGDVVGLTQILLRLIADPEAVAQAARSDLAKARSFRREVLDEKRAALFARFAEAVREGRAAC